VSKKSYISKRLAIVLHFFLIYCIRYTLFLKNTRLEKYIIIKILLFQLLFYIYIFLIYILISSSLKRRYLEMICTSPILFIYYSKKRVKDVVFIIIIMVINKKNNLAKFHTQVNYRNICIGFFPLFCPFC
jgi:hypothetical protein